MKNGCRPLGLFLYLPAALLSSCSGGDEAAAASAGQQAPPPAVVVEEIDTADVGVFRDFVARTEAVETIDIQARVEAILESIEFTEGRPVKKGAPLFKLDSRTFDANLAAAQARLAEADANLKLANEQVSVRAAEAGLEQANAKLTKAEKDVARIRPLAERDAVPRQDLDTAEAAELVAKAEVTVQEATLENSKIQEEVGILLATAHVESATAEVALAQLDLDYCTIESPIDGLIGRTEVDVGNLVGRGEATVLATISAVDPIFATFAISEEEYLVLDAQRRALVPGLENMTPDEREAALIAAGAKTPVELILADDSVYEETGLVTVAERAVDQETGTLQVVAEFPNPLGRLRPGQFGRCRIQVTKLPGAVLCPQRAVMEQQGAKIVFVVGDDDVVALRTIQVSERHGAAFVVTGGLEKGDRVIVEGQLKARPGSPVKPMDAPVSSEPERDGE